jgi:hypothetical protein
MLTPSRPPVPGRRHRPLRDCWRIYSFVMSGRGRLTEVGGSEMVPIGNGTGSRTSVGRTWLGLPALSAVQAWSGSMNARRLARAFIASGLAVLIAAFTLKAGAEVRVGILLAGVAAVELGGLLAIRTRGPIEGFRRKTQDTPSSRPLSLPPPTSQLPLAATQWWLELSVSSPR